MFSLCILHICALVCLLTVCESLPNPRVFLMNEHGNETVGEVLGSKIEEKVKMDNIDIFFDEKGKTVVKSSKDNKEVKYAQNIDIDIDDKGKTVVTSSKNHNKMSSKKHTKQKLAKKSISIKDIENNKPKYKGLENTVKSGLTFLIIPKGITHLPFRENAPSKKKSMPLMINKNQQIPYNFQRMLLTLIKRPLNINQLWISNSIQDREQKREKELFKKKEMNIQKYLINNIQHKVAQRIIPSLFGLTNRMENHFSKMEIVEDILVETFNEEILERQRLDKIELEQLMREKFKQEKKKSEEEKKKKSMNKLLQMMGFMGFPMMPEIIPYYPNEINKRQIRLNLNNKIEP